MGVSMSVSCFIDRQFLVETLMETCGVGGGGKAEVFGRNKMIK